MKLKNFFKFISLILFIAVAIFISKAFYISPTIIREYIEPYQTLAPIIFILTYIIGTVLFLPGSILTIAGGAIFGTFRGTIYNIIAVSIGSTLAFLIARYLGRGFIEDLLKGDVYYLIEICMFIPEFVEYITSENANKISSRGWEKILVKYGTDDDNRLVGLCDFSKIEQRSWRYIQKEKPELLLYRL